MPYDMKSTAIFSKHVCSATIWMRERDDQDEDR